MGNLTILPDSGRLIGIDYGTVRIGIAVCDPGQKYASPLEVYNRRNLRLDAKYFEALVHQENPTGFVVGLPLHTSGQESEKSAEARRFAQWLEELTQRPVMMFDERFTTAIARDYLSESKLSGKKRKERLDKIAAQILLASYLESPTNAVHWKTISQDALDDQESDLPN